MSASGSTSPGANVNKSGRHAAAELAVVAVKATMISLLRRRIQAATNEKGL
jgi:hypothetical protein